MPYHSITIERDELYQQVWTEPIHKLCKQYFLSDRGLGKLCARHNIPVPPRGYWARVAHGQKPKRPPLPALKAGQAGVVHIHHRGASAEIQETSVAELPAEIQFERQPENAVTVPETLQARHPLIESTRRYWAAAKRGEIHYGQNTIPYLNIHVSDAAVARALRLTQALLTAAEQRGHQTTATVEGKTMIAVQGKALEVSLREIGRQVPHRPTEKELAHLKKFSWATAAKFDHIQTGDFELKIENAWDIRHTWRDGKTQRLEDRLNQVMEGLIGIAHLHKERDDRLERQRIEWETERKRQEEEEERVKQWDEWMAAWKRAQDVRAFAAAVRAALAPIEPGSKVEDRLIWADGYADRIDPLRS